MSSSLLCNSCFSTLDFSVLQEKMNSIYSLILASSSDCVSNSSSCCHLDLSLSCYLLHFLCAPILSSHFYSVTKLLPYSCFLLKQFLTNFTIYFCCVLNRLFEQKQLRFHSFYFCWKIAEMYFHLTNSGCGCRNYRNCQRCEEVKDPLLITIFFILCILLYRFILNSDSFWTLLFATKIETFYKLIMELENNKF